MLAESHLYHAQYPVLAFNTSQPGEQLLMAPAFAFAECAVMWTVCSWRSYVLQRRQLLVTPNMIALISTHLAAAAVSGASCRNMW